VGGGEKHPLDPQKGEIWGGGKKKYAKLGAETPQEWESVHKIKKEGG